MRRSLDSTGWRSTWKGVGSTQTGIRNWCAVCRRISMQKARSSPGHRCAQPSFYRYDIALPLTARCDYSLPGRNRCASVAAVEFQTSRHARSTTMPRAGSSGRRLVSTSSPCSQTGHFATSPVQMFLLLSASRSWKPTPNRLRWALKWYGNGHRVCRQPLRLLLVLTAGSVIPQELCMDGVRNPQEGIGEWERNFGKAATPSKKFN